MHIYYSNITLNISLIKYKFYYKDNKSILLEAYIYYTNVCNDNNIFY